MNRCYFLRARFFSGCIWSFLEILQFGPLEWCLSISRCSSTSFILLQKYNPLHGVVTLKNLAKCFKRPIPKTKLIQAEYKVNLSIPMKDSLLCNVLTIGIGRISLSLLEFTKSFSCWTCLFLLTVGLHSEKTIVLDHKTMVCLSYFQLQLVFFAWFAGLGFERTCVHCSGDENLWICYTLSLT